MAEIAKKILSNFANPAAPTKFEMLRAFPFPAVQKWKYSRRPPVARGVFYLEVGKATVAPPLGPWLGGFGVKAVDLVRAVNGVTEAVFRPGFYIKTFVTLYSDKSWEVTFAPPSLLQLLRRAARCGPHTSTTTMAAWLTPQMVYEIARTHYGDGSPIELLSCARRVAMLARAIGIHIVSDEELAAYGVPPIVTPALTAAAAAPLTPPDAAAGDGSAAVGDTMQLDRYPALPLAPLAAGVVRGSPTHGRRRAKYVPKLGYGKSSPPAGAGTFATKYRG